MNLTQPAPDRRTVAAAAGADTSDLRGTRPREDLLPVLEFERVELTDQPLSFRLFAGDVVHLSGGSPTLQRQALALAVGRPFSGGGRCRIDGIDTRVRRGQPDGARPVVAQALLDDTLNAGLPLLANVALPGLQLGLPANEALQQARDTLGALGLAALLTQRPPLLTPAQRRLALIARALAARPRLLVLEQPDTALDSRQVSALRLGLWALTAHHAGSVLMTSGHARLIASADRHLRLEGRAGALLPS